VAGQTSAYDWAMAEKDRLQDYRRKRRFDRTSEPGADKPSRRGSRSSKPRFAIQEHSATSWHFDLRLERDGVLVSFALPRGLPEDPRSNRKAVHTEDHPLEYLTWEGTIPAGSYGAGDMSVYDHGTYEVEKWEPRKIVLTLSGKRVSGKYALFQAGDRKDWMIHRMDEPADRGDPPPEHVKPMMATLSLLPADEEAYAFEVKWDGMRAVAYSEPGRLRLETRTLRDVTAGFPELNRLQRQLGARRAVLDGEIVAFDDAGRPSFQHLQGRMHLENRSQVTRAAKSAPVTYMIFDLLYLDGESLLEAEYRTRRRRLEELGLEGASWKVPPILEGTGDDVLEASRAAGLEGIMAKQLASPYKPGYRGREWLKIKNVLRQEFVIGGFTAGTGRRKDSLGALLVGYYEDGELRYAGKVGTGYSDADLEMLGKLLRPRIRKRSPFAHGRVPAAATSVKPDLVCECSFAEWTSQGLLRQPSFLGLREDKAAADVVREEVSG
jgi:bifunctional non-homologous end joining protein LigD